MEVMQIRKMPRYRIWDRKTDIVTFTGEVFTPEQWLELYAFARSPTAIPVVSGGEINGGFMGELHEMIDMALRAGCQFQDVMTPEQILEAIEAFEDAMNTPPDPADIPPTAEERTAAALEFIAMSSLPDEV